MKKILSFVLALSLIISSFAFTVYGANPPDLQIKGPYGWTPRPVGGKDSTPFENTFRITENGKDYDFTLLNTDLNDPNSTYLVMAQDFYGVHPYDTDGNNVDTIKFNVDDTSNVAHWLNNDFLLNGNTKGDKNYKLPDIIKSNINMQNVWRTECGHSDKPTPAEGGCPPGCPKFFEQTYGVSLLSVSEYHYYGSKIGAYDNKNPSGGNEPWYFRTSCAGNLLFMSIWENAAVRTEAPNKDWPFRPTFYLKKDFFKNAGIKLNIKGTGDEVRNLILNTYSPEEITAAFTAEGFKELKKVPIGGPTDWYDRPVGALNIGPSNNTFAVEENGKVYNFTILDSDMTDENSTLMVLAQDYYGGHQFDPDKTNKFDVSDPNNIAYWLNNDFLTKGNVDTGVTYKLPTSVQTYINKNHTWTTECAHPNSKCDEVKVGGRNYDQNMGVVLMAVDEYFHYKDKFGIVDHYMDGRGGRGADKGWFFRSGNGADAIARMQYADDDGGLGAVRAWGADGGLGIRPQFYLKKDFLRNTKIDLKFVGSDIKKMIVDTCTPAQLSALYTPNEIEFLNDPVNCAGPTRWIEPIPGNSIKTPAERSFKVQSDGSSYTLLNVDKTNSNSTMFVMAQDYYGAHQFDLDKTNKFDVSDPNNIAHWLNNDFLTNGNTCCPVCNKTFKLPEGITNNIDKNHIWRTEVGATGSIVDSATVGANYYETTCGVSLMSLGEFEYYNGKYGLKDNLLATCQTDNPDRGWWLRSPSGDKGVLNTKFGAETGKVNAWDSIANLIVRPEFYLGVNFLKTVKLDIPSMGSEVKKALFDMCSEGEIKALYGEVGFMQLTAGFEPKIVNLDNSVIETLTPGSTIKYSTAINNTNGKIAINAIPWIGYYNAEGTLISVGGGTAANVVIGASGNAEATLT
ncbi:MAG: hypothetical protein RR957_01060, partial [Oscillospiraceae bacterium]